MKKIILAFFIMLYCFAYAAIDYDQLKKDREYCYKIKTSACSMKLINKYSLATREWKNILRYDLGTNLLTEENYSGALEAFRYVLFHESNNKQLKTMAQKRVNEINDKLDKIAQANSQDSGNYYKANEDNVRWQYPNNIKVYIASKTGYEYIFKKAFGIWDEKLANLVNFYYTPKEADADIIIKYVNGLSDNKAGLTRYNTIKYVGNEKYLNMVTVEVSLTNPFGGKYTETNLLSIALHEIEHALGIAYHSESKNDILYFSSESYKNSSISRRDINTVKKLYAK